MAKEQSPGKPQNIRSEKIISPWVTLVTRTVTTRQFRLLLGDKERPAYFVSGAGRVKQHGVGLLPLQVIQFRQASHSSRKARLGGHVGHALATVPEFDRLIFEFLDDISAVSSGHRDSFRCLACVL
jgi:hypothetical protein